MVSQLSISIRCHQPWPDYIISIPFLRLFFGNCQKFQKTSVKCLKFDVSNVSVSSASGGFAPDPKPLELIRNGMIKNEMLCQVIGLINNCMSNVVSFRTTFLPHSIPKDPAFKLI